MIISYYIVLNTPIQLYSWVLVQWRSWQVHAVCFLAIGLFMCRCLSQRRKAAMSCLCYADTRHDNVAGRMHRTYFLMFVITAGVQILESKSDWIRVSSFKTTRCKNWAFYHKNVSFLFKTMKNHWQKLRKTRKITFNPVAYSHIFLG